MFLPGRELGGPEDPIVTSLTRIPSCERTSRSTVRGGQAPHPAAAPLLPKHRLGGLRIGRQVWVVFDRGEGKSTWYRFPERSFARTQGEAEGPCTAV